MGDLGLENREDSMLKILFDIFGQLKVHNKERSGQLLTLIIPKSRNFAIATLVEQVKPAVMDKDDVERRDKSKVKAYFAIFGLSRFWCQENSMDYQSNFLHNFQDIGIEQDGRYQACSYRELRVSIAKFQ